MQKRSDCFFDLMWRLRQRWPDGLSTIFLSLPRARPLQTTDLSARRRSRTIWWTPPYRRLWPQQRDRFWGDFPFSQWDQTSTTSWQTHTELTSSRHIISHLTHSQNRTKKYRDNKKNASDHTQVYCHTVRVWHLLYILSDHLQKMKQPQQTTPRYHRRDQWVRGYGWSRNHHHWCQSRSTMSQPHTQSRRKSFCVIARCYQRQNKHPSYQDIKSWSRIFDRRVFWRDAWHALFATFSFLSPAFFYERPLIDE